MPRASRNYFGKFDIIFIGLSVREKSGQSKRTRLQTSMVGGWLARQVNPMAAESFPRRKYPAFRGLNIHTPLDLLLTSK